MVKRPASLVIAARLTLNVHDLNNEAVAGNVTDIRLMDFVTEDNQIITAPAVSGRMLKHFHLAHMTDQELEEREPKLCAGCRVKEPIRPGILKNNKIAQNEKISENDAIGGCIICDIHGYLIAMGTTASRRISRAMFSWLAPVLDMKYISKQVLHTRVSRQIMAAQPSRAQESVESESQEIPTEQLRAQMLFSKSYASGEYGFVSALDLRNIGYVEERGKQTLDLKEWKRRATIAIKAYIPMLTGNMGASLSHAIPHVDCTELILALSDEKPIIIPFSPMYKGYAEKYMGLIGERNGVKIYTYRTRLEKAERKEKISELFNEILKNINSSE